MLFNRNKNVQLDNAPENKNSFEPVHLSRFDFRGVSKIQEQRRIEEF